MKDRRTSSRRRRLIRSGGWGGGGGSSLPPIVLTWISVDGTSTPDMRIDCPPDMLLEGDEWEIKFYSNSSLTTQVAMASGEVSAGDEADTEIDDALDTPLPDGTMYARARVFRDAAPISRFSNTASGDVDDIPIMTSTDEWEVLENVTLVGTLTANQPSTFVLGGTDAALFEILNDDELHFLVAPDFESPDDAGGNNVYNITITPTAISDSEEGDPQSVTVEVLDDFEPGVGDLDEYAAWVVAV